MYILNTFLNGYDRSTPGPTAAESKQASSNRAASGKCPTDKASAAADADSLGPQQSLREHVGGHK